MNLDSATHPTKLAALRRRVSGAFAAMAVAATMLAGLGVTAAPAHAAVFKVAASQSAASGFSDYGRGSRNISITITGAVPNQFRSVWFGAKDKVTNEWYGDWTSTDRSGNAYATITGIPKSSCGHTFLVDGNDWGSPPAAPSAPETKIVDDCKEMIGLYGAGSVRGDGFAGGYVRVEVNGVSQSVPVSQYHDAYVTWSPELQQVITVPPTTQGQIFPAGHHLCGTVKAFVTYHDRTNPFGPGQEVLVAKLSTNWGCTHFG